jgi:hypothetical protein
MGRARRLFVQIHGQPEAPRHLLADGARERHAVRHRRPFDRHEGHDVHRAQARMFSLVRAQVDALERALEEGEDGGGQRGEVAGEGEHAAVVVAVGLRVEDAHAGDLLDGRDHGVDDLRPAPLADVRHALDDLEHG